MPIWAMSIGSFELRIKDKERRRKKQGKTKNNKEALEKSGAFYDKIEISQEQQRKTKKN